MDIDLTRPVLQVVGSSQVFSPLRLAQNWLVGSHGDIQLFIALGSFLKQHGHRVGLTTHLTFRNPVKESRLECFDIGGHPPETMTYMVKNTGLTPWGSQVRP